MQNLSGQIHPEKWGEKKKKKSAEPNEYVVLKKVCTFTGKHYKPLKSWDFNGD